MALTFWSNWCIFYLSAHPDSISERISFFWLPHPKVGTVWEMQTGRDKGTVPICLSQQFFLFGNEKAEDRYFVFVFHRKLLMTSAKRRNSSNSLQIAAKQKSLLVSSRNASAVRWLRWDRSAFILPTFLLCSTEKTYIMATEEAPYKSPYRAHVLSVKDRNHKHRIPGPLMMSQDHHAV